MTVGTSETAKSPHIRDFTALAEDAVAHMATHPDSQQLILVGGIAEPDLALYEIRKLLDRRWDVEIWRRPSHETIRVGDAGISVARWTGRATVWRGRTFDRIRVHGVEGPELATVVGSCRAVLVRYGADW